jgi:hypothetical protein
MDIRGMIVMLILLLGDVEASSPQLSRQGNPLIQSRMASRAGIAWRRLHGFVSGYQQS